MERNNEEYVCPVCLAAAETAAQLLSYTLLSSVFSWSEHVDGETFSPGVSDAYDEVVHWRSNLFLVPQGKVGKEFVQELVRLITAYGEGSALECIAIKAAMIQCTLLLQRSYRSVSTSDFFSCLRCCLDLWKQGKVNEHLEKGRVIQHRLVTSSWRFDDPDCMTHIFVKHMLRGNVRSALSLLDDEDPVGAPMHLDMSVDSTNPSWTVLDELMKKHPEGRPAHPNALLTQSVVPDFHSVIFEVLNGSLIRSAALMIKGAAVMDALVSVVCVLHFNLLLITCVMA